MNTQRNGSAIGGIRKGRKEFHISYLPALFFVLAVFIFSIAQPQMAVAGNCDYSSPMNVSKNIYEGATDSVTITAVPYENGSTYTWSFNPPLPPWITTSYSSNKQYQITLTVTNGVLGQFYSGQVYVTGTKAGCSFPQPRNTNVKIQVVPLPAAAISPSSAAIATEGVFFSRQMTVECQDAGVVVPCAAGFWSASGLPAGLTIDPATGLISGSPGAGAGGVSGADYPVVVYYKDNVTGMAIASTNFILTVYPATVPLDITTMGLQSGKEEQSYTYTLSATGGVPPYVWSAAGLPAGLTIDSVTGVISGVPAAGTAAGSPYNVTITVRDSAGTMRNKAFSLRIDAADAAVAGNTAYCVTPHFVRPEIKPNLLLLIDNSASMYDLFYTDPGNGLVRTSYYCYDQTFSTANSYPGYFKETSYYEYNFADPRGYFYELAGPFVGPCTKQSANGALCINIANGPPRKVTRFAASGKYLNWLTASKLDIEKEVLTGGKFDGGSGDLVSESRGCLGRKYIKEATAGNWNEALPPGSLGITFAVKGPANPYSASAPSSGGQSYIEIYYGDYIAGLCQNAIDIFSDPNSGQVEQRQAAAVCLSYDSQASDYASKTQNVFIQTVQECWQYRSTGTVGTDSAKGTVENFCTELYNTKICTNTNTTCTSDADCGGGFCVQGPSAVSAGNPSLLCSIRYAGACYNGATNPYVKTGFVVAPVTIDGITYNTDTDCIVAQHNKYCGDFSNPPVVDPTTDKNINLDTASGNVPALIEDMGLQGQLRFPMVVIPVRLRSTPNPGVLDNYKDTIRFGVMQFQSIGTATECLTSPVLCPKVCSNDTNMACTTETDCGPGNFCIAPPAPAPNKGEDAARVTGYIGDPLGNHSYGIINSVDLIQAKSWTPLAEGLYEAVAYYTQCTAGGTNPDGVNCDSSRMPVRINTDDFGKKDPVQSPCQSNNVLILSDGMSTADQQPNEIGIASKYPNTAAGNLVTAAGDLSIPYLGSANVDDIAYYAYNFNIFDPDPGVMNDQDSKKKQRVTTYVVYTGTPCNETPGCTDGNQKYPEPLMRATGEAGKGGFSFAKKESELRAQLTNIFDTISNSASSGTAASVLASGEGSGANLVQAVFYPLMQDKNSVSTRWTGRLSNLWYYVDPFFSKSQIYADDKGVPSAPVSDKVLDISKDSRVALKYVKDVDLKIQKTYADLFDAGGAKTGTVEFDQIGHLWDAGELLFRLGSNSRKIYTYTGNAPAPLFDIRSQGMTLASYMQYSDTDEADALINYIYGDAGDPPGNGSTFTVGGKQFTFRPRYLTLDLKKDDGTTQTVSGIWKLGDVIQSTPRVASRYPLNIYDKKYADTTYSAFVNSTDYRNRGMVFAGANDGMLHAFRLGRLEVIENNTSVKAKLYNPVTGSLCSDSDPAGQRCGDEVWSFIPKNVLPYLKYIADKNYCHIYSVDLTPFIFDASINGGPDGVRTSTSWKTILIGGMRFGGACRQITAACTDCVKTPGVIKPAGETVEIGFSSYFALDISNTLIDSNNPPELMWEFTRPTQGDLGFSSSVPAVVRLNTSTGPGLYDKSTNGHYFVVIGSGPTGKIDTATHQFEGNSDQELKFFVLDLKDGALKKELTTGLTNAFAGSLQNATNDTDLNYGDDVIYFPYSQNVGGNWQGGVGRILTHEDININWDVGTVYSNTGPVTAAVARLEDPYKGDMWLYFGTGRYFYEGVPADDPTNRQALYAIKDPCFRNRTDLKFEPGCPGTMGALLDAMTDITDPSTVTDGWKIDLEPAMTHTYVDGVKQDGTPVSSARSYRAERVITDPLVTSSGLVLFTTVEPVENACDPAAHSFLFALQYNTGNTGGALLRGKALMQVSTGEIAEVDLAKAFSKEKDPVYGGRRTDVGPGNPPSGGIALISGPPALRRALHIKER